MKNYLKLLISLFSTTAIISCGTQKSTETTATTETTKPTEETSGGGGGGGVTPNVGGWPSLDKLPISGSLGASKTSFFNDRAMESRFNTWKEKKDDFAKAIYATSSQGQSDLEDYYKGSKDDWFASNASTVAYNTWKGGAGKAALTTLWKTTADYRTKKRDWVTAGTTTRRSKAVWLGLADSTAPYNTWRVKRTTALKNAWEATTTGATSFTTKLATYTSTHATNTKEKYADLAASTANYNTWRVKRETGLKNAWEATTTGATGFVTKVNSWMTANRPALDTKAEWLANAAATTAFNTWKNALSTEAQRKTIWEDSADFKTKSLAATSSATYLANNKTNFDNHIRRFFYSTDNNRFNINIRLASSGNASFNLTNTHRWYALLQFLKQVRSGHYLPTPNNKWDNFRFDDTSKREYIAQWNTILSDKDTNADLKTDVLRLFDVLHAYSEDGNYVNYAKAQYKLPANSATYNTNFNTWNTDANLRTYYNASAQSDTDFLNYKKTTYKANAGATYNTDLDAWSATKANGLAAYKLSADLTSDYATWIESQYKASGATYNADIDAWSATKSNGVNIYNAHADSTTDYNRWVDPNVRSEALYDANSGGQLDTDLGLWSGTKANGKTTFFAAAASNTAFDSYVNPSPNKVNEYIQSTEFTTNFNNFVTNNLTWTAYKDFFIKQKYNSEAFKKLYYNYLLDQ